MSTIAPSSSSSVDVPGCDLTVRVYDPERDERRWDDLVAVSCNGTFLHSRRFLSYHGDRFDDVSSVVEDRKGRVRAVLPAALVEDGRRSVVSHPGLTYGGLVHDGSIRGTTHLNVIEAIIGLYGQLGASTFRYKAIPHIYHRLPAEDESYSMFRLDAARVRCDLSASVDLRMPRKLTKGRRYQQGVARRQGIVVEAGWASLNSYWQILEANLGDRHGTRPVHTVAEMALLANLFLDEVVLLTAHREGEVMAGGVVFMAGPVAHLQYAAASAEGRQLGAMDLVVEATIEQALKRSLSFFDYGISTVDHGTALNTGLYDYKLSFGAGGVVYEHYEVTLS